MDRSRAARAVVAPRAEPERALVEPADRRREHDAEHGAPLLDERDVHRELAVALQEFLRAVERVDEPEARPSTTRRGIGRRGFFRQHGQRSVERSDSLRDDPVRDLVRLGQRRTVVLELHGEIAGVYLEDRVSRGAGDRAEPLEQGPFVA